MKEDKIVERRRRKNLSQFQFRLKSLFSSFFLSAMFAIKCTQLHCYCCCRCVCMCGLSMLSALFNSDFMKKWNKITENEDCEAIQLASAEKKEISNKNPTNDAAF